MTVNEIVDELRATRPRASDALRLQVLTLASGPAPPARTLLGGTRVRRRLALLVPAAAARRPSSRPGAPARRSASPSR